MEGFMAEIDLEKDSINLHIDPDKASTVDKLIKELLDNQEKQKQNDAESKRLKAVEQELSEKAIPEAMFALGCDDYRSTTGFRVKIDDFLTANIKKSNEEKAHQYLRDNGFGDIIKNTVTVKFEKNEDEEAQKFVKDLHEKYNGQTFTQKTGVHYQTLCATVRDEFRAGRTMDRELLGIYECKKTKLTMEKKR
jgi:hypothetical protein|tara:strand:- start:507 stop:1085 length:579 start_codon:yes stop_codon:yes gene_type:complete